MKKSLVYVAAVMILALSLTVAPVSACKKKPDNPPEVVVPKPPVHKPRVEFIDLLDETPYDKCPNLWGIVIMPEFYPSTFKS